jgi:hypothetical protein
MEKRQLQTHDTDKKNSIQWNSLEISWTKKEHTKETNANVTAETKITQEQWWKTIEKQWWAIIEKEQFYIDGVSIYQITTTYESWLKIRKTAKLQPWSTQIYEETIEPPKGEAQPLEDINIDSAVKINSTVKLPEHITTQQDSISRRALQQLYKYEQARLANKSSTSQPNKEQDIHSDKVSSDNLESYITLRNVIISQIKETKKQANNASKETEPTEEEINLYLYQYFHTQENIKDLRTNTSWQGSPELVHEIQWFITQYESTYHVNFWTGRILTTATASSIDLTYLNSSTNTYKDIINQSPGLQAFVNDTNIGVPNQATIEHIDLEEWKIFDYIQKIYPSLLQAIPANEKDNLQNALIVWQLDEEQKEMRNQIKENVIETMHEQINIKARNESITAQIQQKDIILAWASWIDTSTDRTHTALTPHEMSGSSVLQRNEHCTHHMQRSIKNWAITYYDHSTWQLKNMYGTIQSAQHQIDTNPLTQHIINQAITTNKPVEHYRNLKVPAVKESDIVPIHAEIAKQSIVQTLLLRWEKIKQQWAPYNPIHTASSIQDTSYAHDPNSPIIKWISSIDINSIWTTHQHMLIERCEHLHDQSFYDLIENSIKYWGINSIDQLFTILWDLQSSDQQLTGLSHIDATTKLLITATSQDTIHASNKALTSTSRATKQYQDQIQFTRHHTATTKNH